MPIIWILGLAATARSAKKTPVSIGSLSGALNDLANERETTDKTESEKTRYRKCQGKSGKPQKQPNKIRSWSRALAVSSCGLSRSAMSSDPPESSLTGQYVDMYVYVCRYVGMYVCTYIRTDVYMYICIYAPMYVCMHVCMYACMHV